jgi:hypothetical protein
MFSPTGKCALVTQSQLPIIRCNPSDFIDDLRRVNGDLTSCEIIGDSFPNLNI